VSERFGALSLRTAAFADLMKPSVRTIRPLRPIREEMWDYPCASHVRLSGAAGGDGPFPLVILT